MTATDYPGEYPPGHLSLGPWLKQRRRQLDMTQDNLAQKSHCSLATIRKIEAGDLLPSKNLAQQIAAALNIETTEHAAFVAFARADRAAVPAAAFIAPIPHHSTTPLQVKSQSQKRLRVPAPLTPLVGREWEVQASCALMRRPVARLLTLTGPPGCGKTRLALAIAETLQHEFAGGAAFVPLAAIHDPAMVPAAIAQALGLRLTATHPPMDELLDHLHNQSLLILLDNFEQVTRAAPLLLELLMAAGGVKMLVTSRTLLRLYGEHEFPVPPLPLPDVDDVPAPAELMLYPGVELFVQRAQAVQPSFSLTEENAQAVVQICAWVEGLPLTIEMAAAQVRWNSPQRLLGLLKHRLASLTNGPRYLAPRQQTLRGAIEWSYDLLEEVEQELFGMLALFVGGFTLDAATAIIRHINSLPLHIQSLVDHSLLRHITYSDLPARYEMLETLREFALECLATNDMAAALREAHATYYRHFAEDGLKQLSGDNQEKWLERLAAEDDNFRTAITWCVANDPISGLELLVNLAEIWHLRGNQNEYRVIITQLLEVAGLSIPPNLKARALSISR